MGVLKPAVVCGKPRELDGTLCQRVKVVKSINLGQELMDAEIANLPVADIVLSPVRLIDVRGRLRWEAGAATLRRMARLTLTTPKVVHV